MIDHSDRGSQYYLKKYQRILIKNVIKTSMTEDSDSCENTLAETINSITPPKIITQIIKLVLLYL